jgi:hypothetical protein
MNCNPVYKIPTIAKDNSYREYRKVYRRKDIFIYYYGLQLTS